MGYRTVCSKEHDRVKGANLISLRLSFNDKLITYYRTETTVARNRLG